MGFGFAEDAQIGALGSTHVVHAAVVGRLGFHAGEDHGRSALTLLSNLGNGQAEDGAAVKLKLGEVLRAGQRHHAGVVRTGAQLTEEHALFFADKKLHAPNAGAGQSARHLVGHFLSGLQMLGFHGTGLETLAVVAALLDVTDGSAEECRSVLLRHGEQSDFVVERNELLDNHLHDISACTCTGGIPGGFQLIGAVHLALAVARR